jgi:hypothetical protein
MMPAMSEASDPPVTPPSPAPPPNAEPAAAKVAAAEAPDSSRQQTQATGDAPVEIHVPDKPIHSVKDFALHLVTITTGVLIALSLEGAREWMHHRSLVKEAQANLLREMKDNKQQLDRGARRIEEERKDLQRALAWATDLLIKKESDIDKVSLGTVMPQLSTASWQTAERTGALGHMKYADVKDFAQIYDMQEVYTKNRLQKLERLSSALGIFSDNVEKGHEQPADLQNMRAELIRLLGNLWAEGELARDLSRMYGQAIAQFEGGPAPTAPAAAGVAPERVPAAEKPRIPPAP